MSVAAIRRNAFRLGLAALGGIAIGHEGHEIARWLNSRGVLPKPGYSK